MYIDQSLAASHPALPASKSKMKRGAMIVCGGIVIIIAVFVPTTVNQESSVKVEPNIRQSARDAAICPTFQTPQTPVGRYECVAHKKTHQCKLICPPDLKLESSGQPAIYRCQGGQWRSDAEVLKCVERVSVPSTVKLVEQNLARPYVLNSLLASYFNHSYNYLAMAFFFDRADVHLTGFQKFFSEMGQKEQKMATEMVAYINKRGGWIDLPFIQKPVVFQKLFKGHTDGHLGLAAMETALAMERYSHDLILQTMDKIDKGSVHDPHFIHTLEDEHLSYKVKVIKDLVDHVTILRSWKDSQEGDYELGEFEMDKTLH